MKVRSILVALILTFLASLALAAPSRCPQHYLGGQAPDFLNPKLAQKTQEVCYSAYALIHSGITRTSLVSAEHLTKEALINKPHRGADAFHPDPNIPPADRAELKDYVSSGLDRGHMAPSGDMPNMQAQQESFSLANMVPQNSNLNQNLWEAIEEATRTLAINSGDLYVITGPIFSGAPQKLKGRVLVPTYIYKAIYDPHSNQAAVYFVQNVQGIRYAVIPIAELEKLSGVEVFPGLPDKVKQAAMALPKPIIHKHTPAIEDKTIVPQSPAP